MANPLENEDELYAKIAREHIEVPPLLWDLIYHHIGDDITVIALITGYYLMLHEPMPLEDACHILKYTENIRSILEALRGQKSLKEVIRQEFQQRIANKDLITDPTVLTILNHHVANDTNAINLILGFYLMQDVSEGVSLEDTKEILSRAHKIKEVMDKLRIASSKQGGF